MGLRMRLEIDEPGINTISARGEYHYRWNLVVLGIRTEEGVLLKCRAFPIWLPAHAFLDPQGLEHLCTLVQERAGRLIRV